MLPGAGEIGSSFSASLVVGAVLALLMLLHAARPSVRISSDWSAPASYWPFPRAGVPLACCSVAVRLGFGVLVLGAAVLLVDLVLVLGVDGVAAGQLVVELRLPVRGAAGALAGVAVDVLARRAEDSTENICCSRFVSSCFLLSLSGPFDFAPF